MARNDNKIGRRGSRKSRKDATAKTKLVAVPKEKAPASTVPSSAPKKEKTANKFTQAFNKGWQYLLSVRSELNRVTWPTKAELRAGTIVVGLTVVAVSLFVFVVDNIFEYIFKLLQPFMR